MRRALMPLCLGIAVAVLCVRPGAKLLLHSVTEPEVTPRETVWDLLADDVTATVYNAVPEQCNADFMHTASMFEIDTADVLSHRIIAMERTMMAEYGVRYGDVVRIEGTDVWDGEWQVQDTMNRRFAGMHKIDILVPKNIRHGKWHNVKVFKKITCHEENH